MARPPKTNKINTANMMAITAIKSVPFAQFFLCILVLLSNAHTRSIIMPIRGKEEIKIVSAHSLYDITLSFTAGVIVSMV